MMICTLWSVCCFEILILTEASADYYIMPILYHCNFITSVQQPAWKQHGFECILRIRACKIISDTHTHTHRFSSFGSRKYTWGALGTLPPELYATQSKSSDRQLSGHFRGINFLCLAHSRNTTSSKSVRISFCDQ